MQNKEILLQLNILLLEIILKIYNFTFLIHLIYNIIYKKMKQNLKLYIMVNIEFVLKIIIMKNKL